MWIKGKGYLFVRHDVPLNKMKCLDTYGKGLKEKKKNRIKLYNSDNRKCNYNSHKMVSNYTNVSYWYTYIDIKFCLFVCLFVLFYAFSQQYFNIDIRK
jgi:hypothetical protein